MIETKDYFENNAQAWVSGAYTQNNKENSIGYIRAHLASNAIQQYKPGKNLTICDLGCGNGHFARMLAAQGHTVYGIEQSEEMLRLAREKEDFGGKIKYKQANITNALNLQLPDFDVITSLGVMYYLESDNDIFSFVQKKIKSDGIYMTSCRNKIFNLFPGSNANQALLSDPQLIELLREVFALTTTLDTKSLLNFVQYCRNIELPDLSNENKEDDASSERKIQTAPLLGRQHTPQELATAAKSFGFIVDKTWAFQPHLFSANSVDESTNQIQQQLSQGLMAFCELPIALIWSSHFLSVLRAV